VDEGAIKRGYAHRRLVCVPDCPYCFFIVSSRGDRSYLDYQRMAVLPCLGNIPGSIAGKTSHLLPSWDEFH